MNKSDSTVMDPNWIGDDPEPPALRRLAKRILDDVGIAVEVPPVEWFAGSNVDAMVATFTHWVKVAPKTTVDQHFEAIGRLRELASELGIPVQRSEFEQNGV